LLQTLANLIYLVWVLLAYSSCQRIGADGVDSGSFASRKPQHFFQQNQLFFLVFFSLVLLSAE